MRIARISPCWYSLGNTRPILRKRDRNAWPNNFGAPEFFGRAGWGSPFDTQGSLLPGRGVAPYATSPGLLPLLDGPRSSMSLAALGHRHHAPCLCF